MKMRAATEVDDEVRGATLTEPSAVSAAERAVEAAQRIVVERLELIRLETQEAFGSLLVRAGFILAAGFVAILGWCALAAALVIVLATQVPMSLAVSLALVGGAHVIAGALIGVAVSVSAGRKT